MGYRAVVWGGEVGWWVGHLLTYLWPHFTALGCLSRVRVLFLFYLYFFTPLRTMHNIRGGRRAAVVKQYLSGSANFRASVYELQERKEGEGKDR